MQDRLNLLAKLENFLISKNNTFKVDETARMADVESSFEDRYSKLKIGK